MAIRWRGAVKGGCAVVAGLLLWLSTSGPAAAQSSDSLIRREIAPDESPESRPPGPWTAVPIEELRSFLDAVDPQDDRTIPQTVLGRAVFRGALTDDEALTGRFTSSVSQPEGTSSWMHLGDVGVGLAELAWDGQRAAWGTSREGNLLLLVEDPSAELTGNWSLSGRAVSDSLEYEILLPRAESTRLELSIPDRWRLICHTGIVAAPEPSTEDGNRVWAIEVGRQRRATLILEPVDARSPAAALVAERTIRYAIRADHCLVQADFFIQTFDEVPDNLVFQVPVQLTDLRVTLSAAVSLAGQVEAAGGFNRLIVPLPPLPPGRIGPIRISGEYSYPSVDEWPAPRIVLEASTLVSGRRSVEVSDPMKLQLLRTVALRQTSVDGDPTGSTWTFEDLREDGELVLQVDRRTQELTSRLLHLIDAVHDPPLGKVGIDLRNRSGSAFTTAIAVPPGWTITDVRPAGGDDRRVAGWRLNRDEEGAVLHISFRTAVTPRSPVQLVIAARVSRATLTAAGRLTPLDAVDWRSRTVVRFSEEDDERNFESSSLPAAVRTDLAEWSDLASLVGLGDDENGLVWLDGQAEGIETQPGEIETVNEERFPEIGENGREPESEAVPLQMSLFLSSAIADRNGRWHLHTARFSSSRDLVGRRFSFQLDRPALLDGIRVGSRSHATTETNSRFELAPLPVGTREFEVRYRVPASRRQSSVRRSIPVVFPILDVEVRGLEWQIDAPASSGLTECPLESAVWSGDHSLSWTGRIFGPLARDPSQTPFNPFSRADWSLLFSSGDESRRPNSIRAAGPDTVILRASTIPENLQLELWDRERARSLSWIALILGLASITVVRWKQFRRAGLMEAALALGCLLFAALAPVAFASIAGGAFVGCVIGCLTPRKWLARKDLLFPLDRVDVSKSRAMSVAGAVVIAVWLISRPAGFAQDAPMSADLEEPFSGDSQVNEEPADVLLPEAATEFEPSSSDAATERGYLHERRIPQFLAWRRANRPNPEYLLSAAMYSLSSDPRPRIHAEFDVLIFATRSPVRVSLPLRNVIFQSVDDCRVDGRPATIQPAADSDSFLVDVDPVSSPSDSEPTTDPQALARRESKIELWFTPESVGEDGDWEIGLPMIADAGLVLPEGISPTRLTPTPVSNSGTSDQEAGARLWQIGLSDVLRMSGESAVETGAESVFGPVAEAVSLVEVHPLRLRVRTRLTLSATERSSRRATVSLLLPPLANVREAAGDGLRRFSTRKVAEENSLLSLEFDAAIADGSPIYLDFTVPATYDRRRILIPVFPLAGNSGGIPHHVGLVAARGLTLQVDRSQELPDTVKELVPALFDSTAGGESGWPVPSEAFLLDEPSTIPVTIARIRAVRNARIESRITLSSDRLEWDGVASIDVQGAAVFRHEVEVPADVRIESISVIQDQIDRLLQWSRSGDRLVLHLQDAPPGRHEVRISGWVSLQYDRLTQIPTLNILDSEVSSFEVIVSSSGYDVTLYSGDGVEIEPSRDTGERADGADRPTVARFSLQTGPLPVACRARPLLQSVVVDLVTSIEFQDGRWLQVVHILPRDVEAPVDRLAVDLTRDEASRLFKWPPDSEATRRETEDGVRIEFTRESPDQPLRGRLTFDSGEPSPTSITIPRMTVVDMSVGAELLVLPVDCPFAPDGTSATPVGAEDLSPELQRHTEGILEAKDSSLFRKTSEAELLVMSRGAGSGPEPQVVLEESIIWHEINGNRRGHTEMSIENPEALRTFQVVMPIGTELLSSRVDGRDIVPTSIENLTATFRLPTHEGASIRVLEIEWRAPATIQDSSAAHESTAPEALNGDKQRRIVIHVPPSSHGLIPVGGPSKLTPGEYALFRAELLTSMLSEDWTPDSDEPARAVIAKIAESLSILEPEIGLGPAQRDRVQALLERWRLVIADRDHGERQADSPAHTASPGSPSPYEIAMRDERVVILRGSGADASPGLHVVPRSYGRLALVAVAVVCCVIVSLLVVMTRRWIPSGRLLPFNGSYVGMVVVGVLWWMWFHAGPLGLLVIVWAAVLQATAWRRNVRSTAAAGS